MYYIGKKNIQNPIKFKKKKMLKKIFKNKLKIN